jgi:arylsulfatase
MKNNIESIISEMKNESAIDPAPQNISRRNILLTDTTWAAISAFSATPVLTSRPAWAQAVYTARKPNILMIIADDIGWFNLSAYNMGIMGYRTPT